MPKFETLNEELLSLNDDSIVPRHIFNEISDPKVFAKKLIERLNKSLGNKWDQNSKGAQQNKKLLEDSILMLYFDQSNIPSLKSSGAVLNIHQHPDKSSSGYGKEKQNLSRLTIDEYIKNRVKLDQSILGVQLEKKYSFDIHNPMNKVRHISGFLHIPGYKEKVLRYPERYGQVVIVLNEEAKKRCTWNNVDSMSDISDFKDANFCTFDVCSEEYYDSPAHSGYYEFQIFGGIDIEDIKEFWVDPESIASNDLKLLKNLNRDIYYYNRITRDLGYTTTPAAFRVRGEKVGQEKTIETTEAVQEDNGIPDSSFLITELSEMLKSEPNCINYQDNEGNTPLHYAVKFQYIDFLEFLIDQKADVTIKNDKGQNPLIFAASQGGAVIFEKLLIHSKPDDMQLLLKIAVENKNKEVVEVLLKQGIALSKDDSALLTNSGFIIPNLEKNNEIINNELFSHINRNIFFKTESNIKDDQKTNNNPKEVPGSKIS